MNYYKQIDIETWQEFKSICDNFNPEYIFRGQADSNWELECSLERADFKELDFEIENRIIDEFKRVTHYYLNGKDLPNTNLAWLALIQHHGTPTRLIDFTKSPYIASFFAFENLKIKSEHVAIWCINKKSLYQMALNLINNREDCKGIHGKHYCFSDEIFDKISKIQGCDCLMPFEISQYNERYFIQQSVFLAPLNLEKSTINQLKYIREYKDEPIVKITLPRKIYKTVLRDLFRMNITSASLFPGLDGFARTLNMSYTIPHSLQEFGENYIVLQEKGIK